MSRKKSKSKQCLRKFAAHFKNESVARHVAMFLAETIGVEASLHPITMISPEGVGHHKWIVRVVCTEEELELACETGLAQAISFDSQLIKAGLLEPWNHPRGEGFVPMERYI